jgi:hypothetical protein
VLPFLIVFKWEALPIDNTQHQPQMLRGPRSLESLHLLDDASAAQHAASVSRPVPHPRVQFLRPENRLAVSYSDAHPLPDCVGVLARERENISQKGFNALVHLASRAGAKLSRLGGLTADAHEFAHRSSR